MRARKRNRMVFAEGEPELYEHAQNTRFGSLLDGIQRDPGGRGPVPALGPVVTRPAVNAFDTNVAQEQALGELRRKRTGNPNDPELGDMLPIDDPPARPAPAGGSVTSFLSGGKPYDRTPVVPPWEKGDNSVEDLPPEPATSPRSTTAIEAAQAAQAAPEATANAPQKPDYGRVQAEQIKPQSAGPAPGGGDKTLAALRGVGSVLESAGGRADLGMKHGLDAYGHYQDQERELREYGAKQAELDAATAREQRGENRYAEGQNYGRARDEDSALRESTRDASAMESERFKRGFMERGEQREVAGTEYARGQGRQDDLADYKARKDIDVNAARALQRGRGTGGNPQGRIAQYEAARQRIAAIRGGEDKLTPEDKAALTYAANDKDAGGVANKYADRIEGFTRTDQQNSTKAAAQVAARSDKAAAAKAEASGTLKSLVELREAIKAEMADGAKYRPGEEPFVQNVVAGAPRVTAQVLGQGPSDLVSSATQWLPGGVNGKGRGSTGFTPRQQLIKSGSQLAARAKYQRDQQNSANLKGEYELADTAFAADGTLAGNLARVESEIKALGGAIANDQIVPRDEKGNRIDLDQQQAVPPPPPGFEMEN